jgi:hypothetical protein
VGGWMDGWMGGWMDWWMDGWKDGWMDINSTFSPSADLATTSQGRVDSPEPYSHALPLGLQTAVTRNITQGAFQAMNLLSEETYPLARLHIKSRM